MNTGSGGDGTSAPTSVASTPRRLPRPPLRCGALLVRRSRGAKHAGSPLGPGPRESHAVPSATLRTFGLGRLRPSYRSTGPSCVPATLGAGHVGDDSVGVNRYWETLAGREDFVVLGVGPIERRGALHSGPSRDSRGGVVCVHVSARDYGSSSLLSCLVLEKVGAPGRDSPSSSGHSFPQKGFGG